MERLLSCEILNLEAQKQARWRMERLRLEKQTQKNLSSFTANLFHLPERSVILGGRWRRKCSDKKLIVIYPCETESSTPPISTPDWNLRQGVQWGQYTTQRGHCWAGRTKRPMPGWLSISRIQMKASTFHVSRLAGKSLRKFPCLHWEGRRSQGQRAKQSVLCSKQLERDLSGESWRPNRDVAISAEAYEDRLWWPWTNVNEAAKQTPERIGTDQTKPATPTHPTGLLRPLEQTDNPSWLWINWNQSESYCH